MMRGRVMIKQLLVIVCAALLLAACGSPEAAAPSVDQPRAEPAASTVLDRTAWLLESLNGAPPLAGTRITLEFEDGQAGGFSGCNGYGGQYTATENGALTLRDVASTAMGCVTPVGVLDQEAAYFEAFRLVTGYRVDGDRLELLDAAQNPILRYTRLPQITNTPADLVGTRWRLRSLDGSPPPGGATVTIAFAENEFSGSAGCRTFYGTYTVTADEIAFPSMGMNESDCMGPRALADAERFTDGLTWTEGYRLSLTEFEIFTAQGGSLVWERLPDDWKEEPIVTTWQLESFVEGDATTPALPDAPITLQFDGNTLRLEGEVSGSAGCNTYRAAYRHVNEFTFSPPVSTRKACPPPIMEQESRFLGVLEAVTSYAIDGDQLELRTEDGRALVFRAGSS
jgi:heat shock protein HslJ